MFKANWCIVMVHVHRENTNILQWVLFIIGVLWILKALWINLSENINILRKLQETQCQKKTNVLGMPPKNFTIGLCT